ncbi:dystrophin-like [Teleopsis dalmanni]|uniref:dystrophin-like n=1 Tax=Teleopsis dalmanni TaxID=139649 RepID=UPI0018CFE769|nr:dystrophin-like [Teleopsis dalmanni]
MAHKMDYKSNKVLPKPGDPKLPTIMRHLQMDYGRYKFTVYRCASKFVALQKLLFTANIPYKLVLAVLERHGIREAHSSLMVPPFQLTSLIRDIYFACEKLGHFTKFATYNLESATSVLSNYFWDIFDPRRRHSVSLLEIKMTLLLLCKFHLSEQFIEEFFNLVKDEKTNCVSILSFATLLNILIKIFTYIGEGNGYGNHNIKKVLDQCYERCHNSAGLTLYQFHCLWTKTQTRFLIYANLIALIKRIEDTEKLIHNNICASCHTEKIVGIRFKCQICKNLSLCLKCFATGYATNKHEIGHRMFEVFSEDLPPKKYSNFFAKLCNMFFSNNNEESKGFCNDNEMGTEMATLPMNHHTYNMPQSAPGAEKLADSKKELPQKAQDENKLDEINKLEPSIAGLTTVAISTSERLQTLINKLDEQNIKLELQLKSVKTATNEEISEFLNAHHIFLVDIINEMRNFSNADISNAFPSSSTPNRSTNSFVNKATAVDDADNLTHSINGADLNRSYLDANKSDYSLKDLSLWFNQRRTSLTTHTAYPALSILPDANTDDIRDTEMNNFKQLLSKVKEIVDDSYSDNTELAAATQNLENVLDSIIKGEESRRCST